MSDRQQRRLGGGGTSNNNRSALSQQLSKLRETFPTEDTRALKGGKASILFTARDAADVRLEDIQERAQKAFENIRRKDSRFDAFGSKLFYNNNNNSNDPSAMIFDDLGKEDDREELDGYQRQNHREKLDAKENEKLNKVIRQFLRLFASACGKIFGGDEDEETAADETLREEAMDGAYIFEYLIRRFKVNVYNVDDVIASLLPYHGTNQFVKVVQTCNFENAKKFEWMRGVKESGAKVPREYLAKRVAKDKAFLTYICDSAVECCTSNTDPTNGTTSASSVSHSFYVVLMIESLDWMKRIESAHLQRFLAYLEPGLHPKASSDHYAGCLMLTAKLCAKTTFTEAFSVALLEGVSKGARAPLVREAMQTLLVLCTSQKIETIPDRTFKHFVKIDDASSHVAEICDKYGPASDCLVNPLLEALGKFCGTHENYEKTLMEALEKIELTERRAEKLIYSLARSDKSDERKRKSIERALRAADQRFPKSTAEAVDSFLRGLERRKEKRAHDERRRRLQAKEEANEKQKKKARDEEGSDSGSSSSEESDDDDEDDEDGNEDKANAEADQVMLDEEMRKKEEEKMREEEEQLRLDFESASFLREALSGSASGPIENKKLGNRSLAAALDHPTASIRENATQRLIDLHVEFIEKKSKDKDNALHPPPGLEKGGFLADALCRRCSDDDPTVAALALSAPSLSTLTKNRTSLFEAIAYRLKIAREFSSRTNERDANKVADIERRVCKKAYAALLRQMSGDRKDDNDDDRDDDDDDDELKTLRDKAAAIACYGAVSASHSRAVARSVVKDAARCKHPILLGFADEKKVIEQAFSSAEDAKSSGSRKDVRHEGDARIAASVVHAIGYGFNQAAKKSPAVGEFDLELWVRESYRDADSAGKLTLLLSLKAALAESSSSTMEDIIRKSIWTVLKDDWDQGCLGFGGAYRDERLKDGKIPIECWLSLSEASSAAPWISPVSRDIAKDLFSKITKKDSKSNVAETILIESFDMLAGSESEATNESFETIVQDLLRKCLDASSRRGVDSARFLASRIIAEDGTNEQSFASSTRGKIVALEMIQSEIEDAKDSDEIVTALLVACASSVSSVRRAAADALYCAPTTSEFAPFAAAAKARAQITIDGASALRTAMRSVKVSVEDTKRLLKPITTVKVDDLFRKGERDGSAAQSSSFCLMNPHAARVLLFILRGVGDDQVKAVEIARALERAASFDADDSAPDQLEIAAFAIEAIRCFVGEKLASSAEKTSGKFAFDAFLNAMKSQISVSVRIACFEQIASGSYPLMKIPPISRAKILDVLFHANISDGDKTARAAARAAIASVPLDCKDAVVAISGACKFGDKDTVLGLTKGDSLANAVAAMEVFSWRSDTAVNRDALIQPCQNLCRALFAQNEIDVEEDARRQALKEQNAANNSKKKKKRFYGAEGNSSSSSSDDEDGGDQSMSEDDDDDINGIDSETKKLNEQIAERSYALTLSLQTLTKLAEICGESVNSWDIDLICVSASKASEGSSRAAALELLSEMAKIKPEMVVKKVVDVATTLSRIAGENDDVTLQRALENALKSVIPVWLSSGKVDVREVIWTIVEASTRAPERRRAPLCAALIRACPEGSKGLSELILQVLEKRQSLEKSAEVHKKKMYAMLYQNDGKKKADGNDDLMDLDNNEDVDNDVDYEDDELEDRENNNKKKANAWVKALVMTLLGHEKPVNAVVTLVDAMKIAASRGSETSRGVIVVANAASRFISTRSFLLAQKKYSAYSVANSSELQSAYSSLAERALTLLDTKASSASGPSASKAGRDLFSALDAVLHPGKFLETLTPLLSREETSVRKAALNLLTDRLQNNENALRDLTISVKKQQRESNESIKIAGLKLIEELASLAVRDGAPHSRQAALVALEAAAMRFGRDEDASHYATALVNAAKQVAQKCCFAGDAEEENALKAINSTTSNVLGSAALCLAQIARATGPKFIGALALAAPAMTRIAKLATQICSKSAAAKHGETPENALVVLSATLSSIDAFCEDQLARFMSPYLLDILIVATHPVLCAKTETDDEEDEQDRGDAATNKKKKKKSRDSVKTNLTSLIAAKNAAAELRSERLATSFECRVLMPPLEECWVTFIRESEAARTANEALRSRLAFLEVSNKVADRKDATPAHRSTLFSIALEAMDVRRQFAEEDDASPSEMEEVETLAVNAVANLAVKCTEKEFTPFYAKCVEWAKARAGEKDAARWRLSALFRLTSALADQLRAVFVPFYRHVLDLTAACLDDEAIDMLESSRKKKKKKNDDEKGSKSNNDAMDEWRMKTFALAALRRCFAYDSVNFLTQERFNQFAPLVAKHLSKDPPKDSREYAMNTLAELLDEGEDEANNVNENDSAGLESNLGAECVGCCAALFAAAPDEALWKTLHRNILNVSRNYEHSRAKLLVIATLAKIVENTQEEYLVLLPEAIPFLSELLEDDDLEVEVATQDLLDKLTKLSGEDLASLMEHGYGDLKDPNKGIVRHESY